jgi:hypothetical protein
MVGDLLSSPLGHLPGAGAFPRNAREVGISASGRICQHVHSSEMPGIRALRGVRWCDRDARRIAKGGPHRLRVAEGALSPQYGYRWSAPRAGASADKGPVAGVAPGPGDWQGARARSEP